MTKILGHQVNPGAMPVAANPPCVERMNQDMRKKKKRSHLQVFMIFLAVSVGFAAFVTMLARWSMAPLPTAPAPAQEAPVVPKKTVLVDAAGRTYVGTDTPRPKAPFYSAGSFSEKVKIGNVVGYFTEKGVPVYVMVSYHGAKQPTLLPAENFKTYFVVAEKDVE